MAQVFIVSVPFRGSRSEIRAYDGEGKEEVGVSVPFRGSRSEIAEGAELPLGKLLFPSPFGVHVLK